MVRHRRDRRAAFTLVELLVVITIIGMLMSLLLPAVNQARESARRLDCQVRNKNIALAARNFESSNGYFPGYINSAGTGNYMTSWQIMLSPFMDQNAIYTSWTTNGGTSSPAATLVYWDEMVCPSNPPSAASGPISSFVVNSGRPDNGGVSGGPPDYAANGVCFNLYNPAGTAPKSYVKVSVDYLTAGKGDSYTLFSSENMLPPSYSPNLTWVPTSNPELQCGFNWQETTTPNTAQQINGDRADYTTGSIPAPSPTSSGKIVDYCRPMSNHPGGVNVSFCDGSIRFIQQSIGYNVYQSLMSTNPTYTNSNDASNYASAYINGYLLSNSDF